MEEKTYYLVKRNNQIDKTIPLYVEDISGQSSTLTIDLTHNQSDITNIEYSTDNETWSSTKPDIPANGRVYIRATGTHTASGDHTSPMITSNRNYKVGGNIMSILYGANFTGNEVSLPDPSANYALSSIFWNSSTLISAEDLILPATTISLGCYNSMFRNCYNLITPPAELPATVATDFCYNAMFYGDQKLTSSPIICVTTLATNWNIAMFTDCSSLKEIIVKAESWSISYSSGWVNRVSPTGYFVKPTNTSISTGNSGIPSGWTVINY